MDDKLKLPVIQKLIPEPKWLSMDDYLKFVYLNLTSSFDRKSSRQWKRKLAVKVPFLIRE